MNIPKSVNILGQKWKIVIDKEKLTHSGLHGECDYDKKTIFINDENDDEEQFRTFFHETGHALLARSGIKYSNAFSQEIVLRQRFFSRISNRKVSAESSPFMRPERYMRLSSGESTPSTSSVLRAAKLLPVTFAGRSKKRTPRRHTVLMIWTRFHVSI